MNRHNRCPNCDKVGAKAEGENNDTLLCLTEGCRVMAYAPYYG